jgi:hypothetical protein
MGIQMLFDLQWGYLLISHDQLKTLRMHLTPPIYIAIHRTGICPLDCIADWNLSLLLLLRFMRGHYLGNKIKIQNSKYGCY